MMIEKNEDKQSKYILSAISSIVMFNNLDQTALNEIARCMEHVVVNDGECLIRQCTETDAMYFVVNGSLYARTIGSEGEEIVLGKISPGDPVGEIHILTGGVPIADVIACEKTELLKLPKNSLETLADKNPQAIDKIYEIAGNRLLRDHLASILPQIFGPLDRSIITDIQKQAEWIHLPRGKVLFKEGDLGDGLYLVIMGRLRVVSRNNNNEKILGEAAQGECIGEMSIITSEPRSATVYAIRDCELIRFSKALFEQFIDTYPKVMIGIIRILINRLKMTSCQLSPSSGKVTNITIVPVNGNVSTNVFITRLFDALSHFGQVRHLDSRLIEKIFSASKCGNLSWNETISIKLGAWLHEQETKYSFVVYEADASLTPWTLKCLSQADQVVFLSDSKNESGGLLIDPEHLKDIIHASRSMVILHSGNQDIPRRTNQLLKAWNVDSHHHVRMDSDEDFQRLSRILAGKAVSLVLSGGGARGFAHVGVVRALREHKIPIDMIGGTSMGALVSSWYALGWDDERIKTLVKESLITNNVFKDYTLPLISLIRCRNLDHAMQKIYGETHIEDLWLNYFCVSSNLSMADLEVHKSGILWKAIRASISIPGIAVPVIKNGELLIDGGLLNNLPVDIMRQHCRGTTIAVDVSQVEDIKIKQSQFPSPWKMFYERFFKTKTYQKFPGILDILMRSAELASINQRKKTFDESDFYLRPPVQDYGLLDFERFDELVEIGYQYAKKEIDHWQKEGLMEKCII